MKFHLVSPDSPDSLTSWKYSLKMVFRKGTMPPLGLLTMAAMIPRHHEISICDESIQKINFDVDCDYVCLTGMHIQQKRIKELAAEFRKRGKKIILGGPSVMAIPEEYASDVDIRIVGEAERIWPQCLADLETGNAKSLYLEEEKVDLGISPIPRYDIITLSNYLFAPIQTTRGCPYLCEFCDIITLYGRIPRVKQIDQVLAEIKVLIAQGGKDFFFVDDNFIGDPRYTKKLLTALIDFRLSSNIKFTFSCQATINLAKNHELLELFRLAGCRSVFIGIESPRADSLAETGKVQNLRNDMLTDIRTIRSYGIKIQAGMVVGFDNDDQSIFQEQLSFIQEGNIPTPLVGVLVALPGTPLFQRLQQENRLEVDNQYHLDILDTNIQQKLMTNAELRQGYTWLLGSLHSPKNYTKRILGEIAELEASQKCSKRFSPLLMLPALGWIFLWYLFDPQRKYLLSTFFRSTPIVITKHFSSLEYLVEYLVRYRHTCRIVKKLNTVYSETFGDFPKNWAPVAFEKKPAHPLAIKYFAINSSHPAKERIAKKIPL